MSYQVLARKWRPRSFADMVGQEHVVRAMSNALDRDQIHHAYLFAGTRGVGKTTLARILSKALNCEQGVSGRPCGRCSACREIDEGRFIDLLEVDAASRTKVDQTRELLENVPFAPIKGRFKVYLIDEVHMFSAHSFNALLKTLEEPPTHVKFLLATTDPQKVPATVLSRCLQFNLKRLVPEQITDQFARILEAEGIAFEPLALTLLAQAADGSMRDGLSLLDQAIAFGGGRVAEDEVRTMLGTVDRGLCLDMLQTLARLDRPGLLDEVTRIAELTPDFAGVLQELIGLLHRVALYQEMPATLGEDDPDRERIADLAGRLAPEDVQLFYQIALLGQRDLPLVPDPRTGIEMVLLRMLAFRPDSGDETEPEQRPKGPPARPPAPPRDVPEGPVTQRGDRPAGPGGAARQPVDSGSSAREVRVPVEPASPAAPGENYGTAERETDPAPLRVAEVAAETPAPATYPQEPMGPDGLHGPEDWHRLVAELELGGMASQLAHNCGFAGWDGRRLSLTLDPEGENLLGTSAKERLTDALPRVLGKGLEVEFHIAHSDHETPVQRRVRHQAQHRAAAEVLMQDDPVPRLLQDEFDARWVPGSIAPTP